jgi:hypothetical protein
MKTWNDIDTGIQDTLMKLPVKARIHAFTTMFNQTEYDGGTIPIVCEFCGNTTSAREAHSMAIEYRMPGRNIASYQCNVEQHFGCTRVCASQLVIQCLNQHILPTHDILVQMRDEIEVKERLNLIGNVNTESDANDDKKS